MNTEKDQDELSPVPDLKWDLRLYLLALVIGLGVGVMGSAFHYGVNVAFDLYSEIPVLFSGNRTTIVLVAALLGAVMVGASVLLVRRFAPEAAGSGIQEIEGAMGGLRPVRWRYVFPVKFIGGVLSMGAGLVLGREGPTIHLGGCIGKFVGEKTRASTETLNALLAAGATAGLSVAFSAPLGAIIFMIEEMRHRFKYSFASLHAVIIASITANIVSDQVFGSMPQLPVKLQKWLPKLPPPEEILFFLPFNLVLGALIGILGARFNSGLLSCLHISDRLGRRSMLIVACSVGAVVGALMVVAPDYVGGGEKLATELFSKSPALGVLLALFVVRWIMTLLSYSMGVPGGIFAPMLALGALIGMSFGNVAQEMFPHVNVHAGSFAIASMGALFAATVRAPLTGIVLVAEMTASFELLPAMIVTCMTASIVAQSLGSRPVYDLLLERTLEQSENGK